MFTTILRLMITVPAELAKLKIDGENSQRPLKNKGKFLRQARNSGMEKSYRKSILSKEFLLFGVNFYTLHIKPFFVVDNFPKKVNFFKTSILRILHRVIFLNSFYFFLVKLHFQLLQRLNFATATLLIDFTSRYQSFHFRHLTLQVLLLFMIKFYLVNFLRQSRLVLELSLQPLYASSKG